MILYQDESQRLRLLAPYVREAVKRGGICSFITTQPKKDGKYLDKAMKWTGNSRHRVSLFIHDAVKLFGESSDPAGSFAELLKDMENEYEPKLHRWTAIYDSPHMFYKRVEIVLQNERLTNRRHTPAVVICFYRNEGFPSLDTRDILQLFGLHDRVFFRTTVF